MTDEPDDLPFGLYERLLTAGLKARLLRFDPASTRVIKGGLDPAEAHAVLARHIENVVVRALDGLPQEDRIARQAQLANRLVELLAGNPVGAGVGDETIETPPLPGYVSNSVCGAGARVQAPADGRAQPVDRGLV